MLALVAVIWSSMRRTSASARALRSFAAGCRCARELAVQALGKGIDLATQGLQEGLAESYCLLPHGPDLGVARPGLTKASLALLTEPGILEGRGRAGPTLEELVGSGVHSLRLLRQLGQLLVGPLELPSKVLVDTLAVPGGGWEEGVVGVHCPEELQLHVDEGLHRELRPSRQALDAARLVLCRCTGPGEQQQRREDGEAATGPSQAHGSLLPLRGYRGYGNTAPCE